MMYLLFLVILTLIPHLTALDILPITPINPIPPIAPIDPIINPPIIVDPIRPIIRICTTTEKILPPGCVQMTENNALVATPETVDGTFSTSILRPSCTCTWKPITCSWDCTKPPSLCPPGVPIVNCFANPCVTNPCEEGEICTANYCGGCNRKCTPKTTPAPTLSPTISPICNRLCPRPFLPPICDIYPILSIGVDLSVDPSITPTATETLTTERTITGLPPIAITPIIRPLPLPCRCELDECGCSYKRVCPLPGPCGGNPAPKCAYPAQCLPPDSRFDQNGTIDTITSSQRCLYGCELVSPCTCQFRCKPPPPICVANNMKYNVGETYTTGVKNCTICTCQADRTFECKVDATCLGTCRIPPVCPRPICAIITPDLLTTNAAGITSSVVDIESRVDATGIRYCRFGCELDPTKPCECATRCKPAPICKWENRTLAFEESIIIPNTCKICRCTITGVICDIDLKCQCRLDATSAVRLCPRPVCITPDMEVISQTEISNERSTISTSTSTSTDLIYIPPPLICKYGCELNTTNPCTCQTICKKPPTCEKDGRTYLIGQSYEPSKCQTCTCTDAGFVCTIDRLCQCSAATRCAIPACMTEKGGNATTGEKCMYGCEFDPLKPCGCDTRCLPAPTCPYNGRQVPIGFTYPDDCNVCSCTASGNFICTKRACPVECLIDPCMLPMRDGKCPYGCRANYTIGCNYECLSPINATCPTAPISTIGIISCPEVCRNVQCPINTTCINSPCTTTAKCGTAVCTPIIKPTCNITMNGVVTIYQEGETFAKECNTCTCTANGVACTKIKCTECPRSPPICPAIWNPPPYCIFDFDTDMEPLSSHHGITSNINGTIQKPCVCERDPCSCGFRCKAKQPTCKWEVDGQIYQVGQTFPKDCNNCECLPDGNVTCYRRQCIPTPCIYNNITYTAGQTFPPNCNNMECLADGTIVVLRRQCIETCVTCFVDPCRFNTCKEGMICQTPKCPQNCDYTCVAPKSCTWNNHTYAINETFPEKCPVCQCMPNGEVDCRRDRVSCGDSTGIPSSTATTSNETISSSTGTGLPSSTVSISSSIIDTGIISSTGTTDTGIISSTATIDSSSSSIRIPPNNTCNIPLSGGGVRVYIVGETFELVTSGICERCTCSETTRLICSVIDCRGIDINLTVNGAIPMTSTSFSWNGVVIVMLITIMAFIRF